MRGHGEARVPGLHMWRGKFAGDAKCGFECVFRAGKADAQANAGEHGNASGSGVGGKRIADGIFARAARAVRGPAYPKAGRPYELQIASRTCQQTCLLLDSCGELSVANFPFDYFDYF